MLFLPFRDLQTLRQNARLALRSKNATTARKARKILLRQTVIGKKKDSKIRSLSIRLIEEQSRNAKLQKELNLAREEKGTKSGVLEETVDVEAAPRIDLTEEGNPEGSPKHQIATPSGQNNWQITEEGESDVLRTTGPGATMATSVAEVEVGRQAPDSIRNARGLAPTLSLASIIIPECTPSTDDDEIHRQTFETWMELFNDMMDLAGVSDERTKFVVFKVKAGPRLLEILRNTVSTLETPSIVLNPLENAICRLQNYFSSGSYLMLQRRRLSAMAQLPEESDRSFVLRVAETARYCGYGEGLIRDEVINVVSQRARDREVRAVAVTLIGVENNFTLLMNKIREMLAIRINEEAALMALKQQPMLVAPIRVDRSRGDRDRYKPYEVSQRAGGSQLYRQPRPEYQQPRLESAEKKPAYRRCWRCGNPDHEPEVCWAIRKRCNKCDEVGHIQRVCRQPGSKRRTESVSRPDSKGKQIALLDKEEVVEERSKLVSGSENV